MDSILGEARICVIELFRGDVQTRLFAEAEGVEWLLDDNGLLTESSSGKAVIVLMMMSRRNEGIDMFQADYML